MSDAKSNNSHTGQGAKPLIYVVDDEPMLLELATVILESHGYRVQSFRDPEIALKQFSVAKPRPDLLMTDYAMHSMNGMELITAFRKIEPCQKILLVSGTVDEDIYENSPVRPNHFLAKPYQADQLTNAVRSLIGR